MWTAEDVKKSKGGRWTADTVKNIRVGNKVNINDPINQLSPLERDRAEQVRRSKMGTTKNMTPETITSISPRPDSPVSPKIRTVEDAWQNRRTIGRSTPAESNIPPSVREQMIQNATKNLPPKQGPLSMEDRMKQDLEMLAGSGDRIKFDTSKFVTGKLKDAATNILTDPLGTLDRIDQSQFGKDIAAGVGDSAQAYIGAVQSIGGDKVPLVKDALGYAMNSAKQTSLQGGTGIPSQVVRALPGAASNLALGILSGGASVPAQLGKTAMQQEVSRIASSPAFYNSFLRSYGGAYNQSREEGADRPQAITRASLQAFPQALIEMAGGIENLPADAVKQGLFKTMGKAGAEELVEELLQYPFEGLSKKATYAPKTPWFSTKEEAVINPIGMGENALVGGLVGGLFGGGAKILSGDIRLPKFNRQVEQAPIQQMPKMQTDFYTDQYGSTATDIDASRRAPQLPLMLPAPKIQSADVSMEATTNDLIKPMLPTFNQTEVTAHKDTSQLNASRGIIDTEVSNVKPLNERVAGDNLLNAEDLIDEITSNGGNVDENGYVTLFHKTQKANSDLIHATGKMRAMEDGLFFSTKPDGQIQGYGDTLIELKVPVEKLQIDDVFGDEVHVRIPLKNKNQITDVKEYLVPPLKSGGEKKINTSQGLSNQSFILPNNKYSPNRITPANLAALNRRGLNPEVQRMSDRLSSLNPPIQQKIEPILKPIQQAQQQAAPTVEQAIETPQAKARQKVAETSYTPEEQAQINQFLAEDENYQSLVKELDGINIEDDVAVQNLAQTIQDKAGWRYNMTDIYRNIANQNPQFAEYIKTNYLDKLDIDKGNYANGTQNKIQTLADITKKYGIKQDSLMDKALVWYREGKKTVDSDKGFFHQLRTDIEDIAHYSKDKELKKVAVIDYTLSDLKRDLPNDWQKVVAADAELKPILDDYYTRIQDTLKKIYPYVEQELEPWQKALDDLEAGKKTLSREAYSTAKAEILTKIYNIKKGKRLDYRANYYHHYKSSRNEGIGGLADIFNNPATIDPSLAGLSEFTQPKTRWEAWRQRREGEVFRNPSAIKSMLKYIPAAEYMININPNIAKFRNLAKNITEGTVKTKNANNMIAYITDFADNLAGKTNNTFLDRFFTKNADAQRLFPRALKWVNNRVKGNIILGKISSAVNQLANIPAGIARVKDPKALTKAIGQTVAGNSAIKQSNFMSERYMDDIKAQFDTKLINQPKKFAVWMLGATDKLGTTFIWNGAYNKAVSENNPNPVKYADELTRSVVAGRGVGEVPLWQQSSTFQLIAPFQLEVANLWHVMGDMGKEKDFAGFIVLMLASYMFNKVTEQITGNTGMFDLLGAAEDALLEDDIIQSITQGEFKLKDTNIGEVTGRLAGEALSNLPLGQTLATLVPEYPTKLSYGLGETTIPSRQQLFGENDPTRFGGGLIATKGLQDPLFKLVMPWGGDQLKRTAEGIGSLVKGRVEKNGKLQYLQPPTLPNLIKAPLFGKYSTKEGREYFDKDRRPLSENQTQQVMSSEDPQQAYLRIMQERQINSLNQKIKDVAADDTLTRAEKDKKIEELRQKIIELRN